MKKLLLSLCLFVLFNSATASIKHIPGAFTSIQSGIDSSIDGDTILVQPGIYFERLNYHGKNILLASLYLTSSDTNFISSTVLSPPLLPTVDGSIVTFENGESPSARLLGFTLTGGTGNLRQIGSDQIYYGGAIYCNNASPTLSHLRIIENYAQCGGGIFLFASNSLIEQCTITLNSCNSISFNSPDAGGAIACWNCSDVIIQNNIITNNTVSTAGAGVYILTSMVKVINCLVKENYSMNRGAAFYLDSHSRMEITNCTVYKNHCDYGPGLVLASMMYCLDSASVQINNSIFWGNLPATIVCQFNYVPSEITLAHTLFQGGLDSINTNGNASVNWQNGNLNIYPQFADTSVNNLHLTASSPCVNTGDTAGLNYIPIYDLDNNNRFIGMIDMGCYEYNALTLINQPVSISINPVSIFPNPVIQSLYLKRTSYSEASMDIRVFNNQGKLIYIIPMSFGETEKSIDVSYLPAGIYFVQTVINSKAFQSQFVIAHH